MGGMDFDEYEYLEKTVEDQEHQKVYEDALKKSEKESRRRGRDDYSEAEDDREESRRRSHKKYRDDDVRRKDSDRSSHRSERDDRKSDRERRHGERDSERERRREHGSGDREREKERIRERERREKDKDRERSRRSRSSSRKHYEELIEGERAMVDFDQRENRRSREKKPSEEPEADPERDQRTVFAYQMPLKASERDVYEFFSKAGKVRDVRLIMDRNARRSKGVGYIEFYDVMSVPMAIALSGHLLLGQPVMVKPSEAEKNLVQSTSASGISGGAGLYGPVDRKLYVGNLHFNMTETQLRQIFEPFGIVEVVQLPLDLETGHCKGFGFVQFSSVEQAKAAQSLNGKLDIAGRTIKVSSVTDHVGMPDSGTKTADFDDDGGGLALNAHSRALLMQKLDRTGVASSIAGSLGVPVINGSFPSQTGSTWPSNGQSVIPAAVPQVSMVSESPGNPSECLLLKNMFDPATEVEPDFDVDIKEDVEMECSKFGRVIHTYVEKKSEGNVYMKFESTQACILAQRAMNSRWFAGRMISAIFMPPYDYDAKFNTCS